LLSFETVIVDEEVLEFLEEFFREIVETLDVGVLVVCVGNRDEAVVSDALLAVDLLTFDDSDEAGGNENAGEGWLIHENEDVDGVAVSGDGAGEESEVVGEGHAGGKDGFEREDMLIGVKGELVAADTWGFDDDLEEIVLFIDGFELDGVCERVLFRHGVRLHEYYRTMNISLCESRWRVAALLDRGSVLLVGAESIELEVVEELQT
jgi:hypothetical protein